MRHRSLFVLVLAAALSGCTSSQPVTPTQPPGDTQAGTRLQAADFDRLTGPTWRGALTYLNYGSNELSTIRSTLLVANVSEGVWSWATGYNDEPHADSASEVRLIDSGAAIQSGDTIERVISRTQRGTSTELTTEHQGTDDNRPATIQRVYEISPKQFSIRKLVRFDGEPKFFERHAYTWTR